MEKQKRITPYGEWRSPLSADKVAGDTLRLQQPQLHDGAVYWVEGRPRDKGRSVLVRWTPDGGAVDLIPPPYSVRSRAHEAGGGAFVVRGDTAWFVNDADQRIYRVSERQAPTPVTAENRRRYADLLLDAAHKRLICVCEDHGTGAAEPPNLLLAVNLRDGGEEILAAGADFYSTPVLSPGGGQLAWLQWNHPNLPWDATELWLADIGAGGALVNKRRAAGDGEESIVQPAWSPDGRLHFVSDRGAGWWNIYRLDKTAKHATALTREQAEFAPPRWSFGIASYGFLAAGGMICAFTRDGLWQAARLKPSGGAPEPLSLPYTQIEHVQTEGSDAVLLAGSPTASLRVVLWRGSEKTPVTVRAASELDVADACLSRPQSLSFPTANGDTAYGLYYPPSNPEHAAPDHAVPPLLVKCHGGPTGAAGTALDLKIQFWTSRGFGVLDVNYRGSTGYGRAYRQKLYGRWGVADVADCIHGACHLIQQGRADAQRLCISGSSAGGYTTLCALTFHDVFTAGASYYGIGDLESVMHATHKFEARYSDQLLGPWPAAAAIFHARSPLRHAGRLNRPVIFFQGTDDKVVPPNQAETMVAALRKNDTPVACLVFEGEGHGFRQAAHIRRALEAELSFYGRVLGFKPADKLPALKIENFPPR